ncbi:uncharacterized protein LOC144124576 [Amblyomma americanum]
MVTGTAPELCLHKPTTFKCLVHLTQKVHSVRLFVAVPTEPDVSNRNARASCSGPQIRARSERSRILKELNAVRHELTVDSLPPRSRSDPSRKPRGCSEPRPGNDPEGRLLQEHRPRQPQQRIAALPKRMHPATSIRVKLGGCVPPEAGFKHHHTRTTLAASVSPVENTRTLLAHGVPVAGTV